MPKNLFGINSLKQLATCHPSLQKLANSMADYRNFSVLEGFRGEEAQNGAYAKGNSQKKWPQSLHNRTPSLAMDVAPYPVDWSGGRANLEFAMLMGVAIVCAADLGIRIRLGIDFNQNMNLKDDNFQDFPHIELVP